MSSRRRRAARAHVAPPPEPLPDRRLAAAVGAGIVISAFALYIFTAARDIVFGDTPELVTAAASLGVPHPPGYPLYTMLGWLFAQLPIDGVPFRVTLLSIVSHAATVGVVYAATYRFARSVAGAALAAVLTATQPLFWSWSLVAEVFPLNDLIAASVLFLVALWHDRPERTALLVIAALLTGLGMANHQTVALLAPAILFVPWRRRDALVARPRVIGYSVVALLVGLLPYAELLVAASRQPVVIWGDLRGVGDLVAYALRARYGSTSLVSEPAFLGGSALVRVALLFTTLGVVQVALLVLGVVYAWRTARWYATYLLIAFAVTGPAFAAYANIDIMSSPVLPGVLERFFLLPFTAIAPLAGFTVHAARDVPRRIGLRTSVAERGWATVATLTLLILAAISLPSLDRREDHAARRYLMDVLSQVPQNGVFLAGADGVAFPLLYLQNVEGVRTDVTSVFLPMVGEGWYIHELGRLHPELVLTKAAYGTGSSPFRVFLDANRARPFRIVGDFPDDSAKSAYWLYPRGIVSEVRPLAQTASVEDLARDAEAALANTHPPGPEEIDRPFRPWERLVRREYVSAYYRVGSEYENAANNLRTSAPDEARKGFAAARTWYERALVVDPDYAPAKTALQRLPKS